MRGTETVSISARAVWKLPPSGIVAFAGRIGGGSEAPDPDPDPDPAPDPMPAPDAACAGATDPVGGAPAVELVRRLFGSGGGGGTDGWSGGIGPRGAIPETLRPAIGTCGAIGAMGEEGVCGRPGIFV